MRSAIIWVVVIALLFWVVIIIFQPSVESTAPLPLVLEYAIYFTPPALILIFGYMLSALHQQARQIESLKTYVAPIRTMLFEQQRKGDAALSSLIESKLEQIIKSAYEKTTHETGALMAAHDVEKKNGDAQEPLKRAAEKNRPAAPPVAPAAAPLTEVSVQDFIRALNFPESDTDAEGFRAFQAAMQNPRTAKLVCAAEDILTRLSYVGIYVEDLSLGRPVLELWRQFARGVRGKETFKMAEGLTDSVLEKVEKRIESDPVFKDITEHFLRVFDRTFTQFEKNASDQEIIAFANTRTSSAFMLLGRVVGAFG